MELKFNKEGKCPLCEGQLKRGKDKTGKQVIRIYCGNEDCNFCFWLGQIGKTKDVFGKQVTEQDFRTLLAGNTVKSPWNRTLKLSDDETKGFKEVVFDEREDGDFK